MSAHPIDDGTEMHASIDGVKVTVTIADPNLDPAHDTDVVVFIDTDDLPRDRRIRIRINDALLYEGNPEGQREEVQHNPTDGYFITQS